MTRLISGAILAGAALAAIVYLPITGLRIVAAVVAGMNDPATASSLALRRETLRERATGHPAPPPELLAARWPSRASISATFRRWAMSGICS